MSIPNLPGLQTCERPGLLSENNFEPRAQSLEPRAHALSCSSPNQSRFVSTPLTQHQTPPSTTLPPQLHRKSSLISLFQLPLPCTRLRQCGEEGGAALQALGASLEGGQAGGAGSAIRQLTAAALGLPRGSGTRGGEAWRGMTWRVV